MKWGQTCLNTALALGLVGAAVTLAMLAPGHFNGDDAAMDERSAELTHQLAALVSSQCSEDATGVSEVTERWLSQQDGLIRVYVSLAGAEPIQHETAGVRDSAQDLRERPAAELVLSRNGQVEGRVRVALLRESHPIMDRVASGRVPAAITIAVTSLVLGWVTWRGAGRSSGMGAVWKQARKRASQTLDFLGEGVIVLDTRGTIVFGNEAIHEALERPLHSLAGLSVDALGWASAPDENIPWRAAMVHGASAIRVRVATDASVTKRPRRVFKSTCRPIERGRRVIGVLVTMDDITVLEGQAEELRIARDTAELATRAKSEFLANMSHEIRTPINGVIGTLELVSELPMSGRQRELVSAARGSAGVLLHLINDILDFSKIEAGHLEFSPVSFSLDGMLATWLSTLAPTAAAKGINLVLECDGVNSWVVHADPDRLRQVVINLTANAVKFTSAGEVRVAVQPDPREPGMVRFAVRDTGLGIPPERLDRLFKSFSQVDASTSRRFGGTGLGLAISRQIVELMQGRIGVESTVGVGSEFSFTVPLTRVAATDERRCAVQLPTVVVIEQNDADRGAIARCVGDVAASVVSCVGHDEALTAIESVAARGLPFMVMIGTVAWTSEHSVLAKRVGAAYKGASVIALTLKDVSIGVEDSLRGSVHAWIRKPFCEASLLRQLEGNLSSNAESRRGEARTVLAPEKASAVRVLVVEDNPVGQMVTLGFLESIGVRADVAADGHAAIEMANRGGYDMIFMDCHLPGVDGFDAAKAIRACEKAGGNLVPIIALTASAMAGDRERCLAAGMNGYITKPVQRSDLANAISKTLDIPLVHEYQKHAATEDVIVPELEVSADVRSLSGGVGNGETDPFNTEDLSARCQGLPTLMVDLLELFSGVVIEDLERVRHAAREGNADALRSAAHALAGGALQVGAQRTAALARIIEHAEGPLDVDAVARQIEDLQDEVERCRGAIPDLIREAGLSDQT